MLHVLAKEETTKDKTPKEGGKFAMTKRLRQMISSHCHSAFEPG